MKKNNFDFGKNWQAFIQHINEERIKEAISSLQKGLGLPTLEGKSFLDIGCGSGLFSLAAMRLKADKVYSFDYSPKSVNAAQMLKNRFFQNNANWIITQGSILDQDFIRQRGNFDIVYSWGVLHHTGNMYQALENIVPLVKNNGLLFIAIYNDQGGASRRWGSVKSFYNKLPNLLKHVYVFSIMIPFEFKYFCMSLLKTKSPFYRLKESRERGMNIYHDWVDWVGGWPFEVAKPEEIFEFYHKRNFLLEHLKTAGGGYGNNEFVFKRL